MKHQKHHCPICAAEFETQAELDLHEKRRHTQQGVSGVIPSNEYPPSEEPPSNEESSPSTRKNKEFTRRNRE
jgi:hypothetical protein